MTTYQIQLLLLYLGYSPGSPDGTDGPATRAAVSAFQQTVGGLQADGIAGVQTQRALKQAVAQELEEREETPEFWGKVRYFRRQEFACKCGGTHCSGFPAEPQEALIQAAERVRNHFGAVVWISSGVRCPVHNSKVGGVSNSRHLLGKAADFCVRGFSAQSVLDYVQHLPQIRYAYAIDSSFVHMDID